MIEWLCEDCYKKLCLSTKKEYEIKTISNHFQTKCLWCHNIGGYLTVISIFNY